MFTQTIKDQIEHFENHENVLVGLKGLIDTARSLHSEERKISLLSIRLVGLLVQKNGAGNSRMNQEHFAYYIGLTSDQFWKRSQAYRVIKNYPEFAEMIDSGETSASHVAMLSSQITPANSKLLASGIKGKSTREVRDFIASVRPDGGLKEDSETFIDIKLRLCKSQVDVLERAREILAHSGTVPSTVDLVVRALEELVERRDPMKKADRAEAKFLKLTSTSKEVSNAPAAKQADATVSSRDLRPTNFSGPALKQETFWTSKVIRLKIPAATRHKVWQRDAGYCTHELSKGYLCQSRMMLEVDHIVPIARGGLNNLDNLTLKCRQHNQLSANQVFGKPHMDHYQN